MYDNDILLGKFGYEYESSPENIKLVCDSKLFTCKSKDRKYDRESSYIYEVQSLAIPLKNFSKIFDTWGTVYNAELQTGTHGTYVKGETDTHAGSLHTHISFRRRDGHSLLSLINILAPVIMVLAPQILSRCSDSEFRTQFRDADRYAAFVDRVTGSRRYIKYHADFNTMEVRLNEGQSPMWIYLLPIIYRHIDNFTFCKQYFKEYKKRGIVQEYTDIAVKLLLSLEVEVKEYWQDKIREKDLPLFNKVLRTYFRVGFDNPEFNSIIHATEFTTTIEDTTSNKFGNCIVTYLDV
jgi:hypothetical protein